MANYAYLNACASKEAAARYDMVEILRNAGPEVESKYTLPLFWLSAFAGADTVPVSQSDHDGSIASRFIVLCAPVEEAVARLERRRAGVLALVPSRYAAFYEEWIAFIRAEFSPYLLVRTDDLFSMGDYDEGAGHLLASLQALEPADRGQPIVDKQAFAWFSSLAFPFDTRGEGEEPQETAIRWRAILAGWSHAKERRVWPPAPSAEEIGYVESLPLAKEMTRGSAEVTTARGFVTRADNLLSIIIAALSGILAVLIGGLFVWAGLNDQFDGSSFAIGAAILVAGGLMLQSALRKWRARR